MPWFFLVQRWHCLPKAQCAIFCRAQGSFRGAEVTQEQLRRQSLGDLWYQCTKPYNQLLERISNSNADGYFSLSCWEHKTLEEQGWQDCRITVPLMKRSTDVPIRWLYSVRGVTLSSWRSWAPADSHHRRQSHPVDRSDLVTRIWSSHQNLI